MSFDLSTPDPPRHQPGDPIFVTVYGRGMKLPPGWTLVSPWWLRALHRLRWYSGPATYRKDDVGNQP